MNNTPNTGSVPHSTPNNAEELKDELVSLAIRGGEEYMLKDTSWYADWKARNSIMRDETFVKLGDWWWHIEALEDDRLLATHYFVSKIQLQIEGADTQELYDRIGFAMAQWLNLRKRSVRDEAP